MISYELAFRLKKAGFPQKIKLPPGETQVPEKLCYIPTLEELIEACGEDFSYVAFTGEAWRCRAGQSVESHGSTPSEAVAMLYLKLYDKN